MRLHQDKAEIVKYSQSTIASTSFWRNEANFNRKLIALDFGGVFLGWGRFFFFLGTKGLGENGDSCVVDFRGRNTKTKRALLGAAKYRGPNPYCYSHRLNNSPPFLDIVFSYKQSKPHILFVTLWSQYLIFSHLLFPQARPSLYKQNKQLVRCNRPYRPPFLLTSLAPLWS